MRIRNDEFVVCYPSCYLSRIKLNTHIYSVRTNSQSEDEKWERMHKGEKQERMKGTNSKN